MAKKLVRSNTDDERIVVLNRATIVRAAQEVQAVLKINPPLNLEDDSDTLMRRVLKANDSCRMADDKLSRLANNVIQLIREKLSAERRNNMVKKEKMMVVKEPETEEPEEPKPKSTFTNPRKKPVRKVVLEEVDETEDDEIEVAEEEDMDEFEEGEDDETEEETEPDDEEEEAEEEDEEQDEPEPYRPIIKKMAKELDKKPRFIPLTERDVEPFITSLIPDKKIRPRRAESIATILGKLVDAGTGTVIRFPDLVIKADRVYQKSGGSSSPRDAVLMASYVVIALYNLGILDIKRDKRTGVEIIQWNLEFEE
jgi:hypothetical protein